jgi:hypothetical protein
VYYSRAAGSMGGEMIVVVKCSGEEAGNMLLRRTRMSTHDSCGALVNVHDDVHRCCLVKGNARFTLDCPIECHMFKLKKVTVKLRCQS